MKKILYLTAAIATCNTSFAQSGEKWSTNGNPTSSGDFLGTTNNSPLEFRTNNTSRMTLDANGNLILNNLAGGSARILFTDAKGIISPLPAAGSGQFLQGDGTWAYLPPINKELTVDAFDNIIFNNKGYIGIGTAAPKFPLDVNGDARLGGNMQLSTLAGSGDRSVYVDASGNLRAANPAPVIGVSSCVNNAPEWHIGGDNIPVSIPAGYPDLAIGTCNSTDFILKSNGNQSIWIKPDGKVGIGTAAPVSQLDVNGDASIEKNLFVFGNGSSSRIYAGTQKAISAAVISSYDGFGTGGLYVETNHTVGNSFNTLLKLNRYDSRALAVVNTVASTAGPFSGDEMFTVYGNGDTHMGRIAQIGFANNPVIQDQTTTLNVNSAQRTGMIINAFDPTNSFSYTGLVSKTQHPGDNGYSILSQVNRNYTKAFAANVVGTTYDSYIVYGNGETTINMNPASSTTGNAFEVIDASANKTNFRVQINGSTHMGPNAQIGFTNPATQDPNTALNINAPSMDGIKLTAGFPISKMLSIINPDLFTTNPFTLYGDGVTSISTSYTDKKMFSVDWTGGGAPGSLFEVWSHGNTVINVDPTRSPNGDALSVNDRSAGFKTNFKVKANGTVYAREIFVQLTSFPDYVFSSSYKLTPLSEVESYVKANSHLPNVPTADEVKTNGANLGEIQKANIEKTEELYLYLFELNKKVEALVKENQELKEQINKK